MTDQSTPAQYSNYAFISYKREDERWAKWLQRKLEAYRLPSVIRTQAHITGAYLRPIFRDNTDLGGGVLAEQLHKELDESRYLIVICSPAATKSEWVNAEIQTFIDEGKTDRIIPFVVAGTPRAKNPDDEAFPPALLNLPPDKELLGINVHEIGPERAFIRLVATMLGVKFDQLWQRHKRRQRRNRIITAICAAVVLVAGIFVYEYNRPTYEYFATYVNRNGIPEGVVPLSSEQRRAVSGIYRFRYDRAPIGQADGWKRRLTKVEYINSDGYPTRVSDYLVEDPYPIITIDYSKESGVPVRLNFANADGKVAMRLQLSERNGVAAAVADIIHSQEHTGMGYGTGDFSGITRQNKDGQATITRYVYTRDRNGYIIGQTFHASNDARIERSATSDDNGIFGYAFTLDSLGRRTSLSYLGVDGEPVANKKGVARINYSYNDFGTLAGIKCVDLDGNPAMNEDLWSSVEVETDAKGRATAVKFYGLDGKLTGCKDTGIAIKRNTFDDKGRVIEAVYYDERDSIANLTGSYAIERLRYDGRGKRIEARVYDREGKPTTDNARVHRYEWDYDKAGREISARYFDEEGNLTMCKSGNAMYAAYKDTYNSDGNLVRTDYYGSDGEPLKPEFGVAVEEFKYDTRGNKTELTSYDHEGRPLAQLGNIWKIVREYDERDNLIEIYYLDINGEPTYSPDGLYRIRYEYDEGGHCISYSYFDADGNPISDEEGVAQRRYTFTPSGRILSSQFLGVDGRPTFAKDGTAGGINKYDKHGNRIEYINVDTAGCITYDDSGAAIYQYEFDDRGNRTVIRILGPDYEPVDDKDGDHLYLVEYDTRGNIVKAASYNSAGDVVVQNDGGLIIKNYYNDKGQRIRTENYNINGELTSSDTWNCMSELEYDRFGNITVYRYLDEEGRLLNSSFGNAWYRQEYDSRGRVIRTDYYDAENRPCVASGFCATQLMEYDRSGDTTIVCYTFLDEMGNFLSSTPPKARNYTLNDKLVKQVYLDENEALMENDRVGFAEYRASYDRYGNRTTTSYYNDKGQAKLGPEGIFRVELDYGPTGEGVEVRFFGVDDKPMLNYRGFARQTIERDRFGNAIELRYYGVDGEPVNVDGFHREVRHYDRLQQSLSSDFYDASGESLGNFVTVAAVTDKDVYGPSGNVPLGSYIIAFNEWRAGMPLEALNSLTKKAVHRPKTVTYLYPDGTLHRIDYPAGKMGISYHAALMEKSQAEALVAEL